MRLLLVLAVTALYAAALWRLMPAPDRAAAPGSPGAATTRTARHRSGRRPTDGTLSTLGERNAEQTQNPPTERPVLSGDEAFVSDEADTVDEGGATDDTTALWARRKAAVVEMTKHAWDGYFKYARGHDEVRPVSSGYTDHWGGTGVTAYDAVGTLTLMGLEKEAEEATEILKAKRNAMDQTMFSVSVFETNIRHVGSMLSAFVLTRDSFFREQALYVANKLMHSFKGIYGIAMHMVSVQPPHYASNENWNGYQCILSEVGSLQLEFRYLSYVLSDPSFADAANQFTEMLYTYRQWGWPNNASLYQDGQPLMPHVGLWPSFIDPRTGKFAGAASFASLSDSFYEYLVKQWILFGKKDSKILALYEDAVEAMLEHLLHYTHRSHIAYVGHYGIGFEPTLDHLTCFVPAMLTVGVMHGAHTQPDRPKRWWGNDEVITAAVDLASTCYRLYKESPSGIGPEAARFNADGSYTVVEPKYILRPELVESLFYLYRYTHDEKYREWGWEIRNAIEKYCRTHVAYSALRSMLVSTPEEAQLKDSMESFFFSETLKYLYLLFDDDEAIPLDKYVFNTEGHPFKIPEFQ